MSDDTARAPGLEELAAKAQESERQLRLVMDALPVLISFVTADERYGLVNRAYEEWFGVPREQISGRPVREFIGEAAYAVLGPYVRRGLAGESFTFEQRGVPYRLGGTRDVRVTFASHRDAAGRPDGYVAMLEDVTERRRLEAERDRLAAQRAEFLERQAEFEQQLLGIVSHDLRNPLSAITFSAAALLRLGGLDERVLPAVTRIAAAADRASRMIRDLLDFTRSRLGEGLPIAPAPADLHAVVRQVADEVALAHPGRAVEVRAEGDGRGSWDADRLAQVVSNLVTNALKYGAPGAPVTVTTRGEEGSVAVAVHNAGAPIPPSLRPQLFAPMRRGDGHVDRSDRSIGLGLYIVDQIVRAHGGQVAVDSTAEAGTTFTVKLPRHAEAAAPGREAR